MKKKKTTNRTKKNIPSSDNLHPIFEKRTGGAIAIKGFNFQFLYACYIALHELSEESSENSIRLEGLEDIDILHKNEFIQLKSSKNSIDASKFWDMGVLKNYLDVYLKHPSFNFRFVYDTDIAKGHLKGFESKQLNKKALNHWIEKVNQLKNIDNFNIQEFFKKITFEKVNKEQIFTQCKQLLLEKYDLNIDTEEQFLFSLYYHVTSWSEQRKTIKYKDVLQVIQFVKDASSKTPTNKAIEQNLITHELFDMGDNTTDMGYFDGKSAKPIHIALGLPVERKHWQNKIQESLEKFDVTVIKSSSGQGKSTLAWKVAYDFKKLGFDVYQLNYSDSFEKVEEIFDFIETRIKMGQLPLIVIDGLDKKVEKWNDLVERVFNLPVKMVVTTREEDWYRYGLDASKAQLNIVDIYLNQDEAKKIFEQLKIKNKLHEDIKTWEPIWEKIESKGLLIEYVYLLTHGKMIHERLEQQIKQLNDDKNDAKAKIEILRIIALADILNIRIQTKKLTAYIQRNIGFKSDRGELYKMLEKEYYLQFDKKYIEGLHPVRSQHLVDILHQTIPMEESLIVLLDLIDNDFIYDYFIKAPFFILEEDKKEFYEKSAKIISSKSFVDMVQAIDGLMHYEPYKYWKDNKDIFDDVFNRGLITLFVLDTRPLLKTNMFEEMPEFNNEVAKKNIEYLIEQKNKLLQYDFKNSDISLFSKQLSIVLNDSNHNYDEYKGLDYLVKWFRVLDIKIPSLYKFNEKYILNVISSLDIGSSIPLYTYFYIYKQEEYLSFVNNNKTVLFSILKRKIDSINIEEQNNEVFMAYLYDDEMIDKLHDCSVKKIDIIKEIFPNYERYNAKALYLPFPNEELYKWTIQNSIKAMPKENVFDKFDIHINVIWRKTIMREYAHTSVFEWQEQIVKIRKKILDFIKKFNKAFENVLEKKQFNNVHNIEDELFSLLNHNKEFTFETIKHNEKTKFENEINDISSFKTSFSNFASQLVKIIEDKSSQESNTVLANLKDANLSLFQMHKSFDIIQDGTYRYFETDEIRKDEFFWFDRFIQTISFYMYASEQKVIVAKDSIAKWWLDKKEYESKQIYSILQSFEEKSGFNIYHPLRIIDEANIREIVIGIEGFEEGDLAEVLFGLVDFYLLNIDYINIIRVKDKEASYGFRISKQFFEKVQNEIDGGEYEESEFGNPHPINVTDELLATLDEKILIEAAPEDVPKTAYIEIMFNIWKLMEYRTRLDKNNEIENKWLQENEKNISNKIREKLDKLSSDEQIFISQIIDDQRDISKDEIIELMNEKIGLVQKEQS